MQIVIDISEEEYAWVKRASRQTTPLDRFCVKAIANGTPLPEHGRLIDKDKMIEDLLTVNPQFHYLVDWCLMVTEAQQTIIERSKSK